MRRAARNKARALERDLGEDEPVDSRQKTSGMTAEDKDDG